MKKVIKKKKKPKKVKETYELPPLLNLKTGDTVKYIKDNSYLGGSGDSEDNDYQYGFALEMDADENGSYLMVLNARKKSEDAEDDIERVKVEDCDYNWLYKIVPAPHRMILIEKTIKKLNEF